MPEGRIWQGLKDALHGERDPGFSPSNPRMHPVITIKGTWPFVGTLKAFGVWDFNAKKNPVEATVNEEIQQIFIVGKINGAFRHERE